MARAIMIQGTGSNVGKSLLVAGLARAFADQGLCVAPFKPQNMSNNAAVSADGGEIGRAQALQARAARIAPHTDMNPILLKPESDTGAQVIVQGKRYATLSARDYAREKPTLMARILESFHRLSKQADLVIIEGAGSPAEINLRAGDLANMGFAEAANIPVLLAGDIDRGGVIAQLVGTKSVLSTKDADRIKGFIVNRFRGDPSLFDAGMSEISRRTGWNALGLVPWFEDAWRLPAEDALDLTSGPGGGAFKVAVPGLNRIANFDDLDPLSSEPGVSVEIVKPGRPLPGDANLVLIPGSKATISDLIHFRAQGWDIDLAAHIRRGGHVLGLCGGYQMLGRWIDDPDGIEGRPGRYAGLGHLDIETVMQPAKRVQTSEAIHPQSGAQLTGYEIHLGRTSGADCTRPWLKLGSREEGGVWGIGWVGGCSLHGLYSSDKFRGADLARMGAASGVSYEAGLEATLDKLGAHMARHLDMEQLLKLTAQVG